MMRAASCHSDPAMAGEESLIIRSASAQRVSQRCFAEPVLSEVEGLNSPEDESAVADMTNSVGDAGDPKR
jgi:hypothetical protein